MNQEKPENRPACGWPVERQAADGGVKREPCGSEDGLFAVKGRGRLSGRARETPVCERHVGDAWKKWNVDSAERIAPPPRTTECA